MKEFFFVFFFKLMLGLKMVQGSKYDEPGPFSVVTFDKGAKNSPTAELSPFHARVWAPGPCGGGGSTSACPETTHPVLVYISGFAGGMEITSYESLFVEIASHGGIVVGLDKELSFSGIDYAVLAEQLKKPIAWINDDDFATMYTNSGAIGSKLAGTMLIGGHSAGNHVLMQHLVDNQCGEFGGVLMNSPVDGADPFGLKDDFITPETGTGYVPVKLPGLHIKGSLDPLKKGSFPSCAPEEMANERFVEAWQGPIWSYTVQNVGHLDMCSNLASLYADQCLGTTNNQLRLDFQNLTAALMVAFVDTVGRGSKDGFDYLNAAGGTYASASFSRQVNEIDSVPSMTCEWNPKIKLSLPVIAGIVAGGVVFLGLVIFAVRRWRSRGSNDSDDDLELATPEFSDDKQLTPYVKPTNTKTETYTIY